MRISTQGSFWLGADTAHNGIRAAKLSVILPIIASLSGCVSGRTSEAICSRTEPQRTALAAALVADGGPQSMAAGRTLIATIDAGC